MITNPPQQRHLGRRTHARPAARTAAGGEHQARLAGRLTARDRWIARLLAEHKVLTTHQVQQLAFPSPRATNHRLLDLYRWRVVDRFQPLVASGTAPLHYVLDVAGNAVLAQEDGLDPTKTGFSHEKAVGAGHSLRLAHTVAVNSFFTNLVAHARRPGATGTLTAWWSETRCLRLFGDTVRPDAYGRWHENGTDVEWFLELDYGTETLNRLAYKIADYELLAASTGITTPVLFWFPTSRREANARTALAAALRDLDHPERLPAATTAADLTPPAAHTDPTPARWLPLATTPQAAQGRLRLADLHRAWPHLPPVRTTEPPPDPGRPDTALRPPPPMPPTPDEGS